MGSDSQSASYVIEKWGQISIAKAVNECKFCVESQKQKNQLKKKRKSLTKRKIVMINKL